MAQTTTQIAVVVFLVSGTLEAYAADRVGWCGASVWVMVVSVVVLTSGGPTRYPYWLYSVPIGSSLSQPRRGLISVGNWAM